MNRKKIILVLLLSFFIGLVNVNAYTFSCQVRCSNLGEEYCTAIYDYDGNIQELRRHDQTLIDFNNGTNVTYDSIFSPKNADMCPFENITEVVINNNKIIVDSRDSYDSYFSCPIESNGTIYNVEYYSNGDIKGVLNSFGYVDTQCSTNSGKIVTWDNISDYRPKNSNECPGDAAKITFIKTDNSCTVKVYSEAKRSGAKKVSCGNITGIPKKIPELTSYAVTLVQVAIPVLLVIMGSIDLFKGITAQKEDEIKKGQHMFIKRLIVAVAIFFVVAIVKVFVSFISDATNTINIVECIDCFISGVENCKV